MITTLIARDSGRDGRAIDYEQALALLGREGKQRCGDGWMVRCPAHDDSTPSLKIARSPSGTLLLHCKAGCSFAQVLDALKERLATGYSAPVPLAPSRPARTDGPITDVWAWWVEKTGIPEEWWEENGVSVRHDSIAFGFGKGQGQEVWKMRTPYGQGKYRWEPAGSEHPKPSLWPAPGGDLGDIILTEGETDCATLRYLGYTNAYANTKGAACDIGPALLPLQGLGLRSVTVCYDLDQAGLEGAQKQAEGLKELGIPARQAVLPLPFDALLQGVKDVNDLWHWVEHDRERMQALLRGQRFSPDGG